MTRLSRTRSVKSRRTLPTWRLIKQGKIHATDVAYRKARERGLELTKVEGTGFKGRITVVDVNKAAVDGEEDAGQITERSVNGSGEILETVMNENGEVIGEKFVGNVGDLPIEEEYIDDQGQVVSQAKDDSGNVYEQVFGEEGNLVEVRALETAERSAEKQVRKNDAATAPAPTKSADDLAAALKDCREAGRVGYRIAKSNLAESTKAIDKASMSLSRRLKSLEDGSVGTSHIVERLEQERSKLVQKLEQLHRDGEQHLEEQRKRLDKTSFSLTLFGRTMTGKSTLMEILTHGDGHSIGTGAQRTTRDVRSYGWNGLEVTDVPGVAPATAGAMDENLAFRAAKQADLVLLLISDDAPQPVEAEWFAKVRRLGKPILGICNVKIAVEDEGDLLLFLRDYEKLFDQHRLDDLVQQFHAFADQHIPGIRVPFLFTHLRSRFLADRPEFSQHRRELVRASRFNGVESYITNEVVSHGAFLRVRSFIDASMEPMMRETVALLDFSADNSKDDNVIISKQRQVTQWQQNFRVDGQKRINYFVSKEMEELRKQVPLFAEMHYENRSAGNDWQILVERKEIARKTRALQKELNKECAEALSEFSEELKSELSLVRSLAADRRIEMDKIFDWQRVVRWGVNIATAATIFISGAVAAAAAAVAIRAVGRWIRSWFTDKKELARRARAELTGRLYTDIDRMEKDLRKKLDHWFHEELLGKQVQLLQDGLTAVTTLLFELAGVGRALAWELNDLQKREGRILVDQALRHSQNTDNVGDAIRGVARVPGRATMLVIRPNTVFPENVRADLERLLGEKILFVQDTKNKASMLAEAIGDNCDKNLIRIDENAQVARVVFDRKLKELDQSTRDLVQLGQQLTSLHVRR